MNPFIRRRLPPSVRHLLTHIDIGPKEDWSDAGPASTAIDGMLVQNRGGVSEQEKFLEPARSTEDDSSDARRKALCMLCKCKPSCYSCPRCNQLYCGLVCYQSPAHSACSEEFYKESVLRELKHMGKTEDKERKNIQEILVGLKQKAEITEGGMEGLLKEAGVVSDQAIEGRDGLKEKVEVMVLLSRLAELQQSGKGNETEVEAILRKLQEIGDVEIPPGYDDDEDDEDDGGGDEEETTDWKPDLAERLSQMDVNKLSEQELWEILSQKEKEEFISLTMSGALGKVVPIWKPWWEKHDECTLVEELKHEVLTTVGEQGDKTVQNSLSAAANGRQTADTCKAEPSTNVPPLSTKMSKLSSLCASPSPLICFSLVNTLFVYAFTLALLNGDTDSLMMDFCDMILALSEAFHSSRVFSSVQEALAGAEALMLREGYLDKEDPLAPARALEAVAHIMSGRDSKDSTGYCLAAFSQLRTVLSQARTALSKDGEEGARRHKYFLAGKKCEFYQAWVLENASEIQRVAGELWTEHKKRQSVRKCLEKTQTAVEEQRKAEKRRPNSNIIEEISQ